MFERGSSDELEKRLGQQAAVAALGADALAGLPLEALYDHAVRALAADLGTPFVAVLAADPGRGWTLAASMRGSEGDIGELVAASPWDTQPDYTVSVGHTVVCRDADAEDRFTPSQRLLEKGCRSLVTSPIFVGGTAVAMIGVGSRRLDAFSEQDVSFLESIANTIGVAIGRDRAETELREALRRVTESEARFRDLADSAPVFVWTSDEEGQVDFVNRLWLEFSGRSFEEELGGSSILGVHPDDADRVRDTWWRAFRRRIPWEQEYRLRRHDGDYRWVVDRGSPRWVDGDFAGYVGIAADIHRRKEMEAKLSRVAQRDHEVAMTLQRSLLPERLPEIEGVQLEARYLPAGRHAAVGGDWYDALERDDGRIAVVVGDVIGHGLRAAALMGQLRSAFRAYALIEESPAATLERLSRLLAAGREDVMCTVLHVVLDRDSGAVTYAVAGHPPAIMSGPGGATFLEADVGLPIGTTPNATYRDAHARLEPGAMLLLYTDGLIERRDTPLSDRLAQLAGVAGVAGGELHDACEQIIAGMLGGLRPADDVALLAIRPRLVPEGTLQLTLAARPDSLSPLRRRVGRFLAGCGATEREEFEFTLAICEAAANAIEHAYRGAEGDFEVAVQRQGDRVESVVTDHGRWREPEARRLVDRGRGLAMIETLTDSTDVAHDATGTTVRISRRLAGG